MRVHIVANLKKAEVRPWLHEWMPEFQKRAEITGIDEDGEQDLRNIEADAIVVLGGDGTLLSAARRLNGRKIPLMGVNFGRLGFLASFTPTEVLEHLEQLVQGKLPITRRVVLDISVVPAGVICRLLSEEDVQSCRRFNATALNDAVVTAGPPFHMIELELGVDGQMGARYYGDGVIISTPSGSTAYNISAGGPIINPGVEAFCITPLCPHSLSFRPVVVSSHSTITAAALHVNEGTTLFCDGQQNTRLEAGDRVVVRRSPHEVLLVENPAAHPWRSLAQKLHWAIPPAYNGNVQ